MRLWVHVIWLKTNPGVTLMTCGPREDKKLEALIRRGASEEAESAPEEPLPDLATVLQRFGEEIEQLLGGRPARSREESHEKEGRAPTHAPAAPSLDEQRADLDGRLRAELERQGIVVDGKDIARVVGVAVGKGIEWAG